MIPRAAGALYCNASSPTEHHRRTTSQLSTALLHTLAHLCRHSPSLTFEGVGRGYPTSATPYRAPSQALTFALLCAFTGLHRPSRHITSLFTFERLHRPSQLLTRLLTFAHLYAFARLRSSLRSYMRSLSYYGSPAPTVRCAYLRNGSRSPFLCGSTALHCAPTFAYGSLFTYATSLRSYAAHLRFTHLRSPPAHCSPAFAYGFMLLQLRLYSLAVATAPPYGLPL